MLVSSETFFIADRSRLWLASLHLQMLGGLTEVKRPAFWARYAGQMYVTDCVVQGDRRDNGMALESNQTVNGFYVQGMPTSRARAWCRWWHAWPSAAARVFAELFLW